MRLFHVSEESDIGVFHPRLPTRKDMDPSVGLVWAIDAERLPNFLTPRNCPRVAYHSGPDTSPEDIRRYFTSRGNRHALVIEQAWFEAMKNVVLYQYEFDPAGFELQDAVAGYYVSTVAKKPTATLQINNVFAALREQNVEVRLVENLWDIADEIKNTTLRWSLCRMGYAQPRK